MAKSVVILSGGAGHMAGALLGVMIGSGYSVLDVDRTMVRVAGRGLPGDPPGVLDLPHKVVANRLYGAVGVTGRAVAPYQPVGSKRRHRRNGAKLFARCCTEGVVGAEGVSHGD